VNDDDRTLSIEEYSISVTREGERIVTFCPGGGQYNMHQIPEWAYLKLLSDTPQVDTATQSSDCLRIRIGYRDGQSAGTLISRVYELENRIEIKNISITPHAQLHRIKFPVIADICYTKDNIDGLLYVLQDVDVEFLIASDTEHINIMR
jgi:hypothetical protein